MSGAWLQSPGERYVAVSPAIIIKTETQMPKKMSVDEQMAIIRRGATEILDEKQLREKLQEGRPLVVKLGVDPTAPDIHLGFTVVMRKMRQLQDLGHKIILIVGDYTATIGDPTGKQSTRVQMDHAKVVENARTYQEQFFKIVDREKTTVMWFRLSCIKRKTPRAESVDCTFKT